MLRAHARIAVRLGIVSESCLLPLPRSGNALANRAGRFLDRLVRNMTILNGGNFDMEIVPIEQWSGNALPISLHLTRTAAAFTFQIAEVTTRTRIHRRH